MVAAAVKYVPVKLKLCAADGAAIDCVKVNEVGETAKTGTPIPVPLKLTVWVEPPAVAFEMVPFAAPTTVGLNCT